MQKYYIGCQTCQTAKNGRKKKLGDPRPIELPTRLWGSIATDFTVHLPKTKSGHDAITTYVDRFSKKVHFIARKTTDDAIQVANNFYHEIFRLHGIPDSIVSDRDPKFRSRFWSELMKLCGVKLKLSTSNHPQTDGSSEIMNRLVENFLRCYCNLKQDDWDKFITAAEFSYNSAKNIKHRNVAV